MGIARSIPYCGREIFVGPILVVVPRKVCREKTTTVVLLVLGIVCPKPKLGTNNKTEHNRHNLVRFLVFIRITFVKLPAVNISFVLSVADSATAGLKEGKKTPRAGLLYPAP